MNERIKELIAQASSWVEVDCDHGTDSEYQLDAEKFAELIVQECIDIIAPYTVRMSRPGEEYLHPIQEIKQHFGVEE